MKSQILHHVHCSPLEGHSGFLKTYHRLKRDFYWIGMKSDLNKVLMECTICQQMKPETCAPAGLFQPLPIPTKPRHELSMDFVEGLPKS